MRVLEIEIDGIHNRSWAFPPTGENIRGAFRWHRNRDANAGQVQEKWGDYVPGQLVGIDLDALEGYVAEPLYAQQHERLRKQIEAKKCYLEPPKQTFKAHVPTWLFWILRALDAGIAQVTSRSIQADEARKLLQESKEKPRVKFHGVLDRPEDPVAAEREKKQQEIIDRQQEQINELIALFRSQAAGGHAPGKGQGK